MSMTRRGFNKTLLTALAFAAFLATWSFVVLTVTGSVLYVVPQGRIAN